jgi:hypothetical protein
MGRRQLIIERLLDALGFVRWRLQREPQSGKDWYPRQRAHILTQTGESRGESRSDVIGVGPDVGRRGEAERGVEVEGDSERAADAVVGHAESAAQRRLFLSEDGLEKTILEVRRPGDSD